MPIKYSVIIPAYNEEGYLPLALEKLKETMSQQDHEGEIIVVDNNSTDRTSEIAKEAGVKVVFEPFNQISKARNAGAGEALGEYLVFMDADTSIPPETLRQALKNLEIGNCVGGGALVEFDILLTGMALRVQKLWNWVAKTRQVSGGAFIYCLRETFVDTGGFSENVYASEEIWFCRAMKKWGKKRKKKFLLIENPRIITSSRKMEWFSSAQLILCSILGVFLLPIAIRSKKLCFLWYTRPDKKGK